MADFPLGFPLLGALAGAAWVLAGDGTDDAAKKGAAVGLLVGLGLGALKATADSSKPTSSIGHSSNPASAGAWAPPAARSRRGTP